MTNWIFIWLRNGWKGANGGKVINKPELRQLLRACEEFDAKWVCILFRFLFTFGIKFANSLSFPNFKIYILKVHVEGHSKVKGNLQAHNLAQNGAKKLLRSFWDYSFIDWWSLPLSQKYQSIWMWWLVNSLWTDINSQILICDVTFSTEKVI